jgi:GAF domain-containing protein
MTGAAAAGLMLSDLDGGLHYMGASNESARLLELFQVQHEEGPCLDCYRTGAPVTEVDLTRSPRWPAFAERAVAAEVVSVHAFPMRLRDQVIGALNVFGSEPRALGTDEARILQALADLATIAILQERSIKQAEVLTEQLEYALNSRIVIEQAKGAVARALKVSVEDAFGLMRGHARAHRILLTDLALAIVETPEGPELLRRGS